MKKLLLILGFCSSVNTLIAQGQENTPAFQDSRHNLIGYVHAGSIVDQNNKFLGQFKYENQEISILDSHHKTIGYIVKGTEIQDANHNTTGYVSFDKTDYSAIVKNAQNATVGLIKSDGTVENASHSVVGYAVKTEPMWAAAYYFLLKF